MSLSAVALELDERGLVVAGPNGSGKTSVLTILGAALGGKALEPACPVKVGEHKAEIAVVLGNGGAKYRVSKVFESGKATKLVVELADGTRAVSPQALLDGLVTALSFDPAEFVSPPGARTPKAAEAAQREMLLRACPMLDAAGKPFDLAAHEARRESEYAKRTDVNREVKRLETLMTSMRRQDVPEAVDVAAASAELTKANHRNSTIEAAKRELPTLDASIVECEETIKRMQDELVTYRAKREKVLPWTKAAPADAAALERQIAQAAETNTARATAAASNERLAETVKAVAAERKKADVLDKSIEDLDVAKLAALERAQFPVKGLSVDGERVVMRVKDGVLPFSNLNTATKYAVAFHVLSRLHPALRVAWIRNGGDFDDDHLGALFAEARRHGFQLVVERVNPADCAPCVEMRDGAVEKIDGWQKARKA